MANHDKKPIKVIGIVLILFGLLINPWLIGRLFSYSGSLDSKSAATVIIIGIIFVISGILTIEYRNFIFLRRKEITLLAAALLFTIIILHIFLINFYAFGVENVRVPDQIRHHKLIPSIMFRLQAPDYNDLTELYQKKSHSILTVRVNSIGFEGKEIDMSDNSKTRIVMLGDSFTEGNYVNESFADILGKKLNDKAPGKYEVINTGLGSYSPIIEYNVLKNIALKFNPKIVILNFDMTDVQNDFEYSQQISVKENGDYIFTYKSPVFLANSNSAFEGIYYRIKLFYGIWESFLKGISKYGKGQDVHGMQKEIQKRVDEKIKYSGNIISDPVYAYSYKNEAEFKKHLNRTFYYISRIDRLSKKNNINFAVHSYPHSPQVSRDYLCFRESAGLEKNRIYSNLIFEELKSFAAKENITLWLSNDVLKNSELPPYYPCDMHFNQHGHNLVGEFLFNNFINWTG